MWVATVLAANLYARRRPERQRVLAYWPTGGRSDAEDFCRMASVWPFFDIELAGECGKGDVKATNGALAAYVSKESIEGVVTGALPAPGTLDLGFVQEILFHNFELGGFNEWSGGLGQFSSQILQHISATHCWRTYPSFAQHDIDASNAHTALDIGCGPISRLRWGALRGDLMVTGVDPLNDLYDAILTRHGLMDLPKIRPDRKINAYAETMGEHLNGTRFDFIYSCNALDHTQDIHASFSAIRDAMEPNGVAVLSLNTNEGERQKYEGLHKYNLWIERERLWCSERKQSPLDLLHEVGGLSLGRIYAADEHTFSILLRHA